MGAAGQPPNAKAKKKQKTRADTTSHSDLIQVLQTHPPTLPPLLIQYRPLGRVLEGGSTPGTASATALDLATPGGEILPRLAFRRSNGSWGWRHLPVIPGRYEARCRNGFRFADGSRHWDFEVQPVSPGESCRLARHGPVVIDAPRRRFAHADGTAFFYLADCWWHGASARLPFEKGFGPLCADRREKGFTVIQIATSLSCDGGAFDPRAANEEGFPLENPGGQVRLRWFDAFDRRLRCLLKTGLVPAIVGCWGYHLALHGGPQILDLWRHLLARYDGWPVVWILCGEVSLPPYGSPSGQRQEQVEAWGEIYRRLREHQPQRPFGLHPGPHAHYSTLESDLPVDFFMAQPGHKGFLSLTNADRQLRQLRESGHRPFLIGEGCFEGMYGGCRDDIQRSLFWRAILAGAAGHAYGADGIWQVNWPEAQFGPSPDGHEWGRTPFHQAVAWPGSTQVGVGRRLLELFSWHDLVPAPGAAVLTPTVSEEIAPQAAWVGKVLLVFLFQALAPWGPSLRVTGLRPQAACRLRFYCPMTGQLVGECASTVDPTGHLTVTHGPVLQDLLLALEFDPPHVSPTVARCPEEKAISKTALD